MMQPKLQLAMFVTSLAAGILLAGCPPGATNFTSFTYAGPLLPFGAGGTAPTCPTCQITGLFTVNSPLGFSAAPAYSTYDLKATGLKSFDFKISGWTLGGPPPEFSSANNATVTRFKITGLDSSGNIGNWNIQLGSSNGVFLATCNATAAFMAQHPGANPWDAGFPSGAACGPQDQSPTHDQFSGGGSLLLEG